MKEIDSEQSIMKWIVFVLIFQVFLQTYASAEETRYVSSVEEFFEHTRLHRERVKALGIELFKSHPELFSGLRLEQVTGILEAHDLAKISSASVGPDGRPFYRILFEDGYGRKLDRSIVDVLNNADKDFMEKVIEIFGLKDSPELREKIARIEKIADFVDRGMSKVSPEEFGRAMEKASTFLKSDEDKKLAMELEEKYPKVTENLEYKRLSPLQKKLITHQLALSEIFEIKHRARDVKFPVDCTRALLMCLKSSSSFLNLNQCRLH